MSLDQPTISSNVLAPVNKGYASIVEHGRFLKVQKCFKKFQNVFESARDCKKNFIITLDNAGHGNSASSK